MNKQTFFILLFLSLIAFAKAQDKFYTRSARIEFSATADKSLEQIEAVNKNVTAVLDTKSGQLQFSVLMTGFEFQRGLMQEHFNENYVESSKFPKAEFKGMLTDPSSINYTKDGIYPATVKGKLTLHGITKDVVSTGKLEIRNNRIIINSAFTIMLSDYNISIPSLVADKVSRIVQIKVNGTLEPLKK